MEGAFSAPSGVSTTSAPSRGQARKRVDCSECATAHALCGPGVYGRPPGRAQAKSGFRWEMRKKGTGLFSYRRRIPVRHRLTYVCSSRCLRKKPGPTARFPAIPESSADGGFIHGVATSRGKWLQVTPRGICGYIPPSSWPSDLDYRSENFQVLRSSEQFRVCLQLATTPPMSNPLGVPTNYVHLLGHRCL